MSVSRLSVLVMRGGPSAEREVSLRTGAAVARALREAGHSVSEMDPQPGRVEVPRGTDVVFLALHGTYGEDGGVQGELDRLGVPYTGCGEEASRVAFDKVASKACFRREGVRTPDFRLVGSLGERWPDGMDAPLVVKPVSQGSSVGLSIVLERGDWAGALETALRHDRQALVEVLVRGREMTVGILGSEALPVVEIRPREGGYDYHNKYTPGATDYFCPAELEREVAERVQDEALRAFRAVGCRDYGRVDVMLDEGGMPWVLEVNTLPGMTETSLLPKAAAAAGIGFVELCERMVGMVLARAGEGKGRSHGI
jgi:D-alanine-D-alanine ligase